MATLPDDARARARARHQWQDALLEDREVPHLAVRLALVIASAIDAETGTAKRSRHWLAMMLGCSVRSVEIALGTLGEYLDVERRQVGYDATRARDVHGGAGGANIYRLKLDAGAKWASLKRAKQASPIGAKQASLKDEERAKPTSLNGPTLSEEYFAGGAKQASLSPLSKIPFLGNERSGLRPSRDAGRRSTAGETQIVRPEDPHWEALCDRHQAEWGRRPSAYVSKHDPEGLPGYSFPADWIAALPTPSTSTGGGKTVGVSQ